MNNGRYNAKAVDCALGYTRNQKQQIEILLEVQDGPAKGERISYFGSFSGKAAQYTLEAMHACGWNTGEPPKNVCRNVVPIEVFDELNENNGKTYQKVRIFTPRTSLMTPAENRMSEKEADEFLSNICPKPAEDDLGF